MPEAPKPPKPTYNKKGERIEKEMPPEGEPDLSLGLEVTRMIAECQFYDRADPLYLSDNDCQRIIDYVRALPGRCAAQVDSTQFYTRSVSVDKNTGEEVVTNTPVMLTEGQRHKALKLCKTKRTYGYDGGGNNHWINEHNLDFLLKGHWVDKTKKGHKR